MKSVQIIADFFFTLTIIWCSIMENTPLSLIFFRSHRGSVTSGQRIICTVVYHQWGTWSFFIDFFSVIFFSKPTNKLINWCSSREGKVCLFLTKSCSYSFYHKYVYDFGFSICLLKYTFFVNKLIRKILEPGRVQ